MEEKKEQCVGQNYLIATPLLFFIYCVIFSGHLAYLCLSLSFKLQSNLFLNFKKLYIPK